MWWQHRHLQHGVRTVESNEKAKAVAALGLCCVETSKEGRVVGGICPAQFGEMAIVRFKRHPTGLQVTHCIHHAFGGKYHKCEGWDGGHVCYHAKAILIQAGEVNNYSVSFFDKPKEGATPLWAHPGKIIYAVSEMRPVEPVNPLAELPKKTKKKTVKK